MATQRLTAQKRRSKFSALSGKNSKQKKKEERTLKQYLESEYTTNAITIYCNATDMWLHVLRIPRSKASVKSLS